MNPVSAHDQALAFIMTDSLFLQVDGALSFEIIASQFEGFWRQQIAEEIRARLMPLCVCEQCGNQKEGRIIENAIAVAKKGIR
jgi:hypothetical protein